MHPSIAVVPLKQNLWFLGKVLDIGPGISPFSRCCWREIIRHFDAAISGNVKIQRQKILKSFTSLGFQRQPWEEVIGRQDFLGTNAPVTGDFYMQKAYLVWLLDPCWKSDLEQVKWNIDNCRRQGCGDLFLLIFLMKLGTFFECQEWSNRNYQVISHNRSPYKQLGIGMPDGMDLVLTVTCESLHIMRILTALPRP